ncbi:MAG: HD domain-containing protein [Lachnospiraceae bacterium]|nr:HD domain-containing protein [Lachnospiraceae bacterium]
MVTVFYFIVFIVSLIMLGSMLIRYKKIDTPFLMLGLTIVISCMGRYLIAGTESLDTAILGNSFVYVGGCYTPLLILLVVFKLSNVNMPKALMVFFTTFSTVVMGLALTVGKSDIYYTHVELVMTEGYHYLDKTYAPLHTLYPVMLMLYCLVLVSFMFYVLKNKRNTLSRKTLVVISVISVAIALTYILERVIDMDISYLPVGYLLAMVFFISYFDRLNMYDMSSNVISAMENRKEYGYLVFDRKLRYINANDYVKEVFPEVREWSVDEAVPASESYLYQEVVRYVAENQGSETQEKNINVADVYLEMNVREIIYGRKVVGTLVEFIDRTVERKYYNTIESYNATLEKEVAEKTEHIVHIKDMMVLGMADMVESRDNNTGGHIKRTSEVVRIFATSLKAGNGQAMWDEHFLKMVEKAAPMHDLGKISIEDKVLRKPGKYTEEEFAVMKTHTTEGARIVESILLGVEDEEFVRIAKNVAWYHHERWNGRGYPAGLSGTEIPLEARIMALADVFDALVSKRCYKEAFSYDEAFRIIEEELGQQFDPDLGRLFLACRPQLEAVYNQYR